MRVTGKIIRFDDIRGYGFIRPDVGGDDVFLHVNDLEIDKPLAVPGARVSFEIEEGDRGKFSTSIRLSDDKPLSSATVNDNDRGDTVGDDYFDVLSVREFQHRVTELLLTIAPSLTGEQILEVRKHLESFARKQEWIEP